MLPPAFMARVPRPARTPARPSGPRRRVRGTSHSQPLRRPGTPSRPARPCPGDATSPRQTTESSPDRSARRPPRIGEYRVELVDGQARPAGAPGPAAVTPRTGRRTPWMNSSAAAAVKRRSSVLPDGPHRPAETVRAVRADAGSRPPAPRPSPRRSQTAHQPTARRRGHRRRSPAKHRRARRLRTPPYYVGLTKQPQNLPFWGGNHGSRLYSEPSRTPPRVSGRRPRLGFGEVTDAQAA
jgi:hypothetical protein